MLVIATDNLAGDDYAKVMGLENYLVRNEIEKIQGLRFRAVVVTPGFIMQAERARYESEEAYGKAMTPFDAAMQSFAMTSTVGYC